jgi:hypothetical protein
MYKKNKYKMKKYEDKESHLTDIIFFIGSQVINPQSKTSDLPVIDLSKNHPKKRRRSKILPILNIFR